MDTQGHGLDPQLKECVGECSLEEEMLSKGIQQLVNCIREERGLENVSGGSGCEATCASQV